MSITTLVSIYLLTVVFAHWCFVLQMKHFPKRSKNMVLIYNTKPYVLWYPAIFLGVFFTIGYLIIFILFFYLSFRTGLPLRVVLEQYKKIHDN